MAVTEVRAVRAVRAVRSVRAARAVRSVRAMREALLFWFVVGCRKEFAFDPQTSLNPHASI